MWPNFGCFLSHIVFCLDDVNTFGAIEVQDAKNRGVLQKGGSEEA